MRVHPARIHATHHILRRVSSGTTNLVLTRPPQGLCISVGDLGMDGIQVGLGASMVLGDRSIYIG